MAGNNVEGRDYDNSQGTTPALAWRKGGGLSQDSWPPSQKLNLRPSKYKAEVLTIQYLVASKNLED